MSGASASVVWVQSPALSRTMGTAAAPSRAKRTACALGARRRTVTRRSACTSGDRTGGCCCAAASAAFISNSTPVMTCRARQVMRSLLAACWAGARSRPALGCRAALLAMAFQDPYDRHYRVPVPRRRGRTKLFVELAQIADRFHVTPVHSEHEPALCPDDPDEPLSIGRKRHGERRRDAASLRHDGHESNDLRA